MGYVKAVQFVIIIWPNKSNWFNLGCVLRLLKSNLPKLAWHHVTSVYWKIVALIVGSAEIEGGARCPRRCGLHHPTLYKFKANEIMTNCYELCQKEDA